VEDDGADLDDIIVMKHGSFDSLAIEMRANGFIKAFQNSIVPIMGYPAVSAGNLWQRNSKITGQIPANGHFLMKHGKDPFVVSL
tara:strand:+ start:1835 stop:2086 length:252 start_codon:yes stop_codon:yes gene_type:complete